MDDSTPPIAWDTTWKSAVDHFGNLNSDSMRAMSDLVVTLSHLPDLQGLFAIPSMTTLRISPYSCYPDWFDGRSITVDANGPDAIIIRVATNAAIPNRNVLTARLPTLRQRLLAYVANKCRVPVT